MVTSPQWSRQTAANASLTSCLLPGAFLSLPAGRIVHGPVDTTHVQGQEGDALTFQYTTPAPSLLWSQSPLDDNTTRIAYVQSVCWFAPRCWSLCAAAIANE